MAESDSQCIGHEPCPKCGSRDNLARYDDGHGWCFGCGHYEHADGTTEARPHAGGKMSKMIRADTSLIDIGEVKALGKRKITEETCRKFGYTVGTFKGKPVQIANYRRDGQIVAQKVRFANKDFTVRGDLKEAGLFGQHLWSPTRRIVITEGEIDALSVSQMQGNKWPVVSVPNGAQGAKKSLARELEWLEQFEEVVLMFDMDEPGQEAAAECALLFSPGKCKIAHLPAKDPNELLVAGKGDEIVKAMWNAKAYRPDGIVTFADVRERALKKPPEGLPWPWPQLTKLTYGRRYGEVYALGAGTGVGKTDVFTQIIAQTALDLNEKCALFYLEQPPSETAKRVAGKAAGKRFHVPDAGWTQEELVETFDKIEATGNIFMYDSFGVTEWDVLLGQMKFLVHAEGVKHVFLDHLTALTADVEDERKELERIMAELAGFAQANQVCFYFVSHLATPDGTPHEEGGRVMIRHFKGSRAIGFWAHFMFGLERDQQAESLKARQTTTFRVLKDRNTGQATGEVFYLGYDVHTGLLAECESPDDDKTAGFDDEDGDPPF